LCTETVIFLGKHPHLPLNSSSQSVLAQAWLMSNRTVAAALIARQDGLITRKQAKDLHLSDQVIRGFRKRGEWQTVLPGVPGGGGAADLGSTDSGSVDVGR
jgi:hypothetical protein